MQLSHDLSQTSAVFDEDNLVACAGLVPVMALARRAGLGALVGRHLTLKGPGAPNAPAKVACLVAGMAAGADSIEDMDLLRHGAMTKLFGGLRAPSTLGVFLRSFSFGHARQLEAVATRFLAALAGRAPLLPDADAVSFVDVDDTIKATYGYAKQGAGYGYSGVKGLNALIATVSTPQAAPVIAATRLRAGSAASVRGAGKFVADAISAARAAGAGGPDGTGLVIVRADSAYYTHTVVAAARRAGARFSITTGNNPSVRAAITTIDEDAWTAIEYPEAVWDEQDQRWVSDAQVAEVPYTAFTGRPQRQQVTARLIVRRVKRLNPTATAAGQGEMFTAYRYHAVFTDSPMELLQAESQHRGHAVIEGVHADLRDGPLAHLPSGSYAANAAWLACAAMTYNLLRAAGTLTNSTLTKARGATLRARLVAVPARVATSARRLTLHLPTRWPWHRAWELLNEAVRATSPPPRPAAA